MNNALGASGRRGQSKLRLLLIASASAAALLATTVPGIAPALAQQTGTTGAASADSVQSFDIPAQDLNSALLTFADVSGLQVFYDLARVEGRRSQTVRGELDWRAALEILLSDTGLAYRVENGTVILQPVEDEGAGTTQLNPINVEAAAPSRIAEIGSPVEPYAGGQVARGGKLGLLGNRDFMDTPFNQTSYTSKLIEDRQAKTIADVMHNDPSVSVTHPSGGILDSFYVRGFPLNEGNFGEFAFNGMFGVGPTFRVFTDYAESVEVIKGPTALLNGVSPNSAVGGTINVTPKRAGEQDFVRLTPKYTSVAEGGGHIDVSQRFGDDRAFGMRANVSYSNGETAIDKQKREAPVGALALDYTGEDVRATLDLIGQREDFEAPLRPIFPLSGFAIPEAPEADSNLQESFENSRIDDISAATRVEVDLTDNLMVFAGGGAGSTIVRRLFGTPVLNNNLGDVTITPQNFLFEVNRQTADIGGRGEFDTGPISHQVTLQGSYFHETLDRGVVNGTAQTSNIFNPVTRAAQAIPDPVSAPRVSENEFTGFALADTLSAYDDRVQVTVGVRRQQVETKNFSATTGLVTSSSNEAVFSPLAGIVVKPWKDVSVYANYIEGLSIGDTAPNTAVNAGETLDPAQTRQFEIGTKFDFGRFATTVSLFQIEKPSGQLETVNGQLVFGEFGEQRNRGLEISTFGEITPDIRVIGGVTLIDAELTDTASAATEGNTPVGIPWGQLNLGAEWDTPFLDGFTLTGNLIAVSEQEVNNQNTQDIPAWGRIDLGLRYETELAGNPALIRGSVQNVLDTDYWAGVASFSTLAQGTPRTFLLSVTTEF